MKNHSLLPFAIHRGEKRVEILDKRGLPVAHIYARGIANGAQYRQNVSDNATYIVQACNSHSALVEALGEAVMWINEEDQGAKELIAQCRAALALAKGEQ